VARRPAKIWTGTDWDDIGDASKVLKTGDTITGPTVVDVNSSSTALRITQVGSGNALLVEDSANPDATPFVVNASGAVVIGHTADIDAYRLQIQTTDGAAGSVTRHNAASTGPVFRYIKSRSTSVGGVTSVNSGDTLGTLAWHGADGTGYIRAASIVGEVDGTPGTNDMPGRLVFSTTADGASTPTERMRITQAGNVGIGTSSPGFKLEVTGGDIGIIQSSAAAALWLTSTGGSGRQWILISNTNGGLSIFDNTGSAERFRIDNAGLITGTGTSLGAWTTYTPTLGGTGWALGNGTASGFYCQIGKIVHFRVKITLGSTSTAGNGALTVSPPITAKGDGFLDTLVKAAYFDASLGGVFWGDSRLANSSSLQPSYRVSLVGAETALTTDNPFTWATSDQINISGTYEAA
jgi:hypothetical protein